MSLEIKRHLLQYNLYYEAKTETIRISLYHRIIVKRYLINSRLLFKAVTLLNVDDVYNMFINILAWF